MHRIELRHDIVEEYRVHHLLHVLNEFLLVSKEDGLYSLRMDQAGAERTRDFKNAYRRSILLVPLWVKGEPLLLRGEHRQAGRSKGA